MGKPFLVWQRRSLAQTTLLRAYVLLESLLTTWVRGELPIYRVKDPSYLRTNGAVIDRLATGQDNILEAEQENGSVSPNPSGSRNPIDEDSNYP